MKEFKCNITNIVLLVSQEGKVFKEGKEIRINSSGHYPTIELKNSNVRRNYMLHRILAELYIENTLNKPFVNHIDGNKFNYSLNNLEWCTHSENMIHAVKTGLQTNCLKKGEEHNTSKHSFAKVNQIREDYKTKQYSMRQLAKKYNTSSGYISDVVNNKIRNLN